MEWSRATGLTSGLNRQHARPASRTSRSPAEGSGPAECLSQSPGPTTAAQVLSPYPCSVVAEASNLSRCEQTQEQ